MKPFTKKLITFVKNFIYIVTSYVAAIIASAFILWILIVLVLSIADMETPHFSQKDICEIVLENQDDLEMIVEDLRSYDMAEVYVNKENIRTYMNLVRIPDGRYMLGDEGPDFSTSEELQHFMKELQLSSIKFSLYEELQIVTFEFYDGRIKGAYWVDPDTPTEKACTSHHDLTPSGDGWEFEDYGDRYYTEKICDNWYYFVVET